MAEWHDELVTALAGRYVIERELGHGGMAVVYLAQDLTNRRRVALKVMRRELAEALGPERFLQEIAIAAPLVHPNIISLYDSGTASGFLYYTMPYIEGETLRQRLDREVQLPIPDAIAIARQVASALDYAHAHGEGAVHRDIKPENILLRGDHVMVSDFGLARAVRRAASTPLTRPGVFLGTPPYMSPEQCTPDGKVNPPSDIYSLGCVVFEMIAGMPPFRGATVEIIMAHHVMTPPPSVCEERSSCPPMLDDALRRALAKVPADRYRTGGEFVHALDAAVAGRRAIVDIDEGMRPASARGTGRSGTWRARTPIAVAAAVAVLVSVGALAAREINRDRAVARADTTSIVVFPVEGDPQLPLRQAGDLLREGAGRWRGVTLVSAFDAADARSGGGRATSNEDARWLTLKRGAGRFIAARLSRVGEELRLHARLVDAGSSRNVSEATARLPNDLARADSIVAKLADSLFLRDAELAFAPIESRVLPAVQSYAAGRRAILHWNLRRADTLFSAAVEADPSFAQASLWLAQSRSWQLANRETWFPFAERASASGRLSPREERLAAALLLIGRDHFDAACREYQALVAENERDFAPWYGLGQCRHRDVVVVRDARTPSGWRFRASYHQAALAYARALELAPALHQGFQADAFQRLRTLLFARSGMVREGVSGGSTPARFLAFPTWQGDTLAFVPYPRAEFSAGQIPIDPSAVAAAVRHQRELFAQIARSWSAALPNSPGPKEAVALSLEMLGDASALDTLRLARSFASGGGIYELWLAVEEVFVRLEFARTQTALDSVRLLADSLLEAHATATGPSAGILTPVAALRGRCRLASRFARGNVSPSGDLPGHLRADFSALTLSAAMGCREPEYLPTADRLVKGAIASRPELSPADQRQLEISQLSQASTLVFPADSARQWRLAGESNDYLWRLQKAALAGDTAVVRADLRRMATRRGPVRSTTVSPDALFAEAQLWLSIGDTAAARRWLDAVIDSPGWLAKMLDDPVGVASYLRCFALRAEIAAPNERRLRERWARIVATMWTGSDPGPAQIAVRASGLLQEE